MASTVLIVGGGRVGRHVAEQLSEQRNTVTVIERDPERCDQVAPSVSRVIEGSGTDPEVFAQADPERLDVVAALTDDTKTNLTVCELAREHAPQASTILRIARDGEQDYGHRSIVDRVVYPAAAAADVTADQITRL